jgi:phosphohistidine phosphatase SixA
LVKTGSGPTMKRRQFIAGMGLFTLATPYVIASNQGLELSQRLLGSNVLLMRHALAPGFGDPKNFEIGNCATQRNLNDEGRRQAQQIGSMLTLNGLDLDAVYSSQWCRCLETAELMDVGLVQAFAGLNSFFQSHAPKKQTLELLREKLDGLPKDKLTLMVTHQVVIQSVTSLSVQSGGIVAYDTTSKTSQRLVVS